VSALALVEDVGLDAVVLLAVDKQLKGKGVDVATRVTDGTIDRTMTGASTLTLTVEDERRDLLRSGLLSYTLDLQVDGLWWRLVKVTKQGDQLALTFEDRVVAYLRQITTPRKASRSSMTRAEFALSIVREVRQGEPIPFVCPELHVVQAVAPIGTSQQQRTSAQRTAAIGPGLSTDAKLTVQGAPATDLQKQNAQRVLDVAASVNAGTRPTLALMEAVIVESGIMNLGYGDATSTGILQVLSSTAAGLGIDARDIEQCCNTFLTRGFTGAGGAIAVAAKYPNLTSGQIAQTVQGSNYPGRYDQRQTEAQEFVNAYSGSSASAGPVATSSVLQPYQFQRGGTAGIRQDSWACLQQLAQQVNWRCFVNEGAVYFVSETTLLKAKPTLTIDENVVGVDGIDFDIDNGKVKSTVTVTARANRWGSPPGVVVVLDNCGPADGRWLVEEVSRDLFNADATITLKRATKPFLEPPPTTKIVGGSAASPLGATTSPLVARAYQAAQTIDAKHYPYVWGGGHAHVGTPDGGQPGGEGGGIGLTGYDCSGSTCAVLGAAGMGFTLGAPAESSGPIAASWGVPGEGKYLTVWANTVHVFMIFHTTSGDQHFGTGFWGKSWDGPGFNPEVPPQSFLSQFTPRHWPGT
jgi:hypothetical protein